MLKVIIILLAGLVASYSFLSAGIIGAMQWKNGNKTVVVYYNDNNAGSENVNRTHFDYIKKNVLYNQTQRIRPLKILVENSCGGKLAYFKQEIDRLAMKNSFLGMFDFEMEKTFTNNVCIKSTIPYNELFLIDTLIENSPNVLNMLSENFLEKLINDLSPTTLSDLENEASYYMKQYCLAFQKTILQPLLEVFQIKLHDNIKRFKSQFYDCHNQMCPGFTIQFTQSLVRVVLQNNTDVIKNIDTLKMMYCGWHEFSYPNNVDLEPTQEFHFFLGKIFEPLINARLLCEVFADDYDLAIFANKPQCFFIEDVLEACGFVSNDMFFTDRFFNEPKENDVLPLDIYEWMTK